MNKIKGILGIADNVSIAAANLGGFVILLASLITTYDVGMRFLFNSPTSWALELAQYSLLFSTFIGGAFALLDDGYIRVEIVTARLPRKVRYILDLGSDMVIFILFAYLTYITAKFSYFCFLKGWAESTPLRTPLWMPLAIIPTGCVMIAFQQFAILHKKLLKKK